MADTYLPESLLEQDEQLRRRARVRSYMDEFEASTNGLVPSTPSEPDPSILDSFQKTADSLLEPFRQKAAQARGMAEQGVQALQGMVQPQQPQAPADDPFESLLTPFRQRADEQRRRENPSQYGAALTTVGGTPEAELVTRPGGAGYTGPRPGGGEYAPVAPDEPVTRETVTRAAATALARAGLPVEMAPYVAGIAINEGILQPGTIARDYWSVGGVKAPGTAGVVTVPTREVINGQSVMEAASFGKFNSMQEGMDSLATFIRDSPRFGPVAQEAAQTGDYAGMIEGFRQKGYATDPNWSRQVNSIAGSLPTPQSRPATPMPAAGESTSAAFQDLTKQWEGLPYAFGGKGGRGGGITATDCSGFVSEVWKQRGLDLPAHTDAAYNFLRQNGQAIEPKDARSGDVVFYMGAGTGGAITHHMGVVKDRNTVVDMSVANGGGVKERPIGHAGEYVIMRDPRLNPPVPPKEEEPAPRIIATGIAEQTGGTGTIKGMPVEQAMASDRAMAYRAEPYVSDETGIVYPGDEPLNGGVDGPQGNDGSAVGAASDERAAPGGIGTPALGVQAGRLGPTVPYGVRDNVEPGDFSIPGRPLEPTAQPPTQPDGGVESAASHADVTPPPSGNPIVDLFSEFGRKLSGVIMPQQQSTGLAQAGQDIQLRQATMPGTPQTDALAQEPMPLDKVGAELERRGIPQLIEQYQDALARDDGREALRIQQELRNRALMAAPDVRNQVLDAVFSAIGLGREGPVAVPMGEIAQAIPGVRDVVPSEARFGVADVIGNVAGGPGGLNPSIDAAAMIAGAMEGDAAAGAPLAIWVGGQLAPPVARAISSRLRDAVESFGQRAGTVSPDDVIRIARDMGEPVPSWLDDATSTQNLPVPELENMPQARGTRVGGTSVLTQGQVAAVNAVGSAAGAAYDESQREGSTPESIAQQALGAAGVSMGNTLLGKAVGTGNVARIMRATQAGGDAADDGSPPRLPPPSPPEWMSRRGELPPGATNTAGDVRSGVDRATDDFEAILREREAVAKGAPKPPKYAQEVDDAFSFKRYLRNPTAISDRREGLQAVEEYVGRLTGQPMLFEDRVWTRARVYEGQGDAALAWVDRTLGPSMKAYRDAGGNERELDALVEQLDNHFKNLAAQRKAAQQGIDPPERMFSGGARAQELNDIWGALINRVGEDRARLMMDTAERVAQTTAAMRNRLAEAGVISEETRAFWEQNFPMYVRANILERMDDGALKNLPQGGHLFGSSDTTYRPLSIRGTERFRESPLSTVMDMAVMTQKRAERNVIAQRVAAWADIPGMQGFVRHVREGVPVPDGWTVMPYLVGGRRHDIAVVDQLVPAMTMSSAPHGLVAGILAAAAQPLRKGATVLRASFIAANAFNDALATLWRFGVESPNPEEFIRSIPDMMRGYRVALGTATGGRATGAAIGAVIGNQSAPEDATWQERVGRAAAGAALGAGGAKALGKIDAAGDATLLQRMRESGASIYTGTRWDSRPDLMVRELMGDRVLVRSVRTEGGLRQRIADEIGRVGDVVGLAYSRPLEAIGAPIEQAPRIAAYARKERQLGIPTGLRAMPTVASMPSLTPSQAEAALAARRVTVDFGGGGNYVKAMNMAIPFLNPTTQASLEFAQMARQHPAKVIAAFATVASAVIANEVYNRHIAPDDYKDVTRFTKNSGIVILSDEEPPEGGKRELTYLPLRGGMGAMVPLIRDAFARYHQEDPATIAQLFSHMFGALTPFPGDPQGALGAVTPPLVGLGMELASNTDFYSGRNIVARSMEGLPASEQYGPRTPDTARWLSESDIPLVGGKPPVAIEHALKGISPGPAETLLGMGDMILAATDTAPPRREGKDRPFVPSDTPVTGSIAGRFQRTVGEEQRTRAYEKADDVIAMSQERLLQMVRNSSAYQAATPDDQARMLRSAQDALSEAAREMTGATPKTKDYGQPSRFLGVPSGSEREQQIAAAMAVPAVKRTVAQSILAQQYAGRENPRYAEWSKKRRETTGNLRDAARQLVGVE